MSSTPHVRSLPPNVSLADLLKDTEFEPSKVQRIAHRRSAPPLKVVPYDPAWPSHFQSLQSKIMTAVGKSAVSVAHTGSTSIPGIPAKPIIDIDAVVSDVEDEAAYVPALEAAGFHFILREPHWHGHRFFCTYGQERPPAMPCNLHVWGAACPTEVERHRIFRDWLLECAEDRELYARTKAEASSESLRLGESMMEYTQRKEEVIRQVLKRAFRNLG
ncbi:grpb/dephospho-CoA kinase [Xylariaceae sp. FL0804]|nr:grpb/dephospho-CoA kinase [Xylariaceae sp. FL0804]